MTSSPRRHDALLPGELRDDPRGRRSARDWVVDVVMYLIAVGVGLAVLLDTWKLHGHWMAGLDIVQPHPDRAARPGGGPHALTSRGPRRPAPGDTLPE
jgi:hypothetical protein